MKDSLEKDTQTVELLPSATRIDVTAQMGDDSVRTSWTMLHGATSLRVESNGDLVVEDITIGVDDVVLHHPLLPEEGVRLMNITAHLVADMEARTTWENDNEATATSVGDLVVEWAIMNHDGQPAPLAPQTLRGIPFTVEVDKDGFGDVDVTLTGSVPGRFWQWADYIELSDLDFSLAGSTGSYDVPADEIVQ